MEPLFDLFGILFVVIVVVFVRVITRVAAAASKGADDKNATGTPAQSVAKADAHPVSSAEKAFTRIEMQRHISARKAELQAKRANKTAAQATPSSKNPTKSQLQAAAVQPAQAAEPSMPDGNKWMEGFDIRRAVVWSEILRPKFMEDEA